MIITHWRIIISVFLVHAFAVKSILCIVNHMIISNIHNITPKSGILFTYICIADIFNSNDFMKHWLEVMFYTIICEKKMNHSVHYECLRANRECRSRPRGVREAPFTIYSWTIRIMCYVKVWNHIIAICSLVFRRWFLIRCAILVQIILQISCKKLAYKMLFRIWMKCHYKLMENLYHRCK